MKTRRSFIQALALLVPAALLAPFVKAQPQELELPDELKITEGFKGTFDDMEVRQFGPLVQAFHFSNKGKKELVIFVFQRPHSEHPVYYKAMGYGREMQPLLAFHMQTDVVRTNPMIYGPCVPVNDIILVPPTITVTYSHA